MDGAEFSINRGTTMKKLFALIFLASLSSPASAMPAIFGVTTNGSRAVPYGAKLTSETDGVVVVELDPPSGDPGDVTFDPNPISVMPTLPDDFVLPPVADAPDPGLIPGSIGGSIGGSIPGSIGGSIGGNESSFATLQMLENAIPMPRGGNKKWQK